MADGMKRPVGLEDDRVFFRLAIAKITHAPKRAGDLRRVDFVQTGNSAMLPQEFVGHGIGCVYEHRNMVKRLWKETSREKDFVGTRPRCLGIDGKLQVIAKRWLFQAPGDAAARDQ